MKQNKHLQTTYIYIYILDHSGTLLRQLNNHVVLGPLGSNMRSNSLLHTCHVQVCRNAFGDTGPAVMPVCWITKMSSSTWPIVNTNPQKEQTHASRKKKTHSYFVKLATRGVNSHKRHKLSQLIASV